jgi:hypothetical protein
LGSLFGLNHFLRKNVHKLGPGAFSLGFSHKFTDKKTKSVFTGINNVVPFLCPIMVKNPVLSRIRTE